MDIPRPEPHTPIPPHAKKVFEGEIFDIYQWEQELYDGRKKIFEKAKRPDTVIVFGALPGGKILIAEQEQPGSTMPFISGLGGRIEPGEDPLEAAEREFEEESGYRAERFELWLALQPVGKLDWAVYVFIAKGLSQAGAQQLDGGEKIALREVSLEEFIELGTGEGFSEDEVVPELVAAKYDAGKREELRKRFDPSL